MSDENRTYYTKDSTGTWVEKPSSGGGVGFFVSWERLGDILRHSQEGALQYGEEIATAAVQPEGIHIYIGRK